MYWCYFYKEIKYEFLSLKKKSRGVTAGERKWTKGGAELEERVVCGHFRRKEKIIKLFFHGLGEYVIRYGPPVLCAALQQSKKEKPKSKEQRYRYNKDNCGVCAIIFVNREATKHGIVTFNQNEISLQRTRLTTQPCLSFDNLKRREADGISYNVANALCADIHAESRYFTSRRGSMENCKRRYAH